ncbi:MAG: glycerophosphodiester phosphodiesterase, partial [Clostridia bacterium]|nr:glycerophosphodiester phosphodiesterase [Clostridia bacterium]
MQKVKLAAHRGYSSKYPENTMLAFREALKYDIDMVENDVHMTKDGELVLMHDHKVNRTTNGDGLVRELTLEQVRLLDAGSWKGEEFKGEKVPTFREFCELFKNYPDIEVNIELKDYP